MAQPRTDPTQAARNLVAALPALIEQSAGAGGPLALAVYALRTALSEAECVVNKGDRPGPIISAGETLRRFGD